jgi:hypothetical protein
LLKTALSCPRIICGCFCLIDFHSSSDGFAAAAKCAALTEMSYFDLTQIGIFADKSYSGKLPCSIEEPGSVSMS